MSSYENEVLENTEWEGRYSTKRRKDLTLYCLIPILCLYLKIRTNTETNTLIFLFGNNKLYGKLKKK